MEPESKYDHVRKLPLADKKKHAWELYCKHTRATDIAKTLDIKLPTLKAWIYGNNNKKDAGWKVKREMQANQLIRDLASDKKSMVYGMVDNTLYLLYDFVDSAKKESIVKNRPIDIKTAEKLTSILMNLHTIIEKEKDNDDDPNFKKPTTEKEMQARYVKADPFAEKEEIEVAEIVAEKPIQNGEESKNFFNPSDDDIIIEDD